MKIHFVCWDFNIRCLFCSCSPFSKHRGFCEYPERGNGVFVSAHGMGASILAAVCTAIWKEIDVPYILGGGYSKLFILDLKLYLT